MNTLIYPNAPKMEWESKIVNALMEMIDCTNQNARGIADANKSLINGCWHHSIPPYTTADLIYRIIFNQ